MGAQAAKETLRRQNNQGEFSNPGVGARRPRRVVMVTECSMSDNVAVEFPDVEFVRPCALCPHMKRITLPKILWSLENLQHEVTIEPEMAERARLAVDRMLAIRPRGAR